MRTRNPDARWRAILLAEASPESGLERALWELLHQIRQDPVVSYAHEIHSNVTEREILQAWIISRADDAAINKTLRIPLDVLAAYRQLFFDVSLFRDELDLLSWVAEYESERRGTKHGAQLLRQAMTNGVDALLWIYGRGDHVVDPQRIQQQAMTDAFMRGRAHRGHEVSSAEARAAMGFLKMGADLADRVAQRTGGSGLNDLLIKLRHRDMTEPVEAIPHGELLH